MLKRNPDLNPRGGSMMPREDFENFVKKPIAEMQKDVDAEAEQQEEARREKPPMPPRLNQDKAISETAKVDEEAKAATKPLPTDDEILLKQAAEFGIDLDEREVYSALVGKPVRKRMKMCGGRFEAVIKTLNAGEISEINTMLGKDMDADPAMLRVELQNRNTIYLLASCVSEMGEPGDTRTLPADLKERVSVFRNLSPQLIQELARRYNCLTFLLEHALRDDQAIKNS